VSGQVATTKKDLTMNLKELASHIGATTHAANPGDLERNVHGVQTIENAGPEEITFLTNPRFRKQLAGAKAAAVVVGQILDDLSLPQLVHPNPYAAMAKASSLFQSYRHAFQGQSPLAFIHPDAKVHPQATIYPFAYIDQGAQIEAGAIIYPNCYIGIEARIGARSILFPGVTVMTGCQVGLDNIVHPGAVIGGDGFGFAPTAEGIEKIPQIGAVRLGDDVEIGSNTTVDRGAFDDTTIGKGCKLDSHVHVGHGSQLGDYSMMCGLSGLAGSVKTGKRFVGAGFSGIAPGVELPDGVTAGAMCGMLTSQTEPGLYHGMPAVPANEWRRQAIAVSKLPELLKTVRTLTARLEALEAAAKT